MKVTDIDWDTWQPELSATLLFVIKQGQVLLIRKKRGLGAGKINGPGGHIEIGETPRECAIRETQEELLITPLNVQASGELFFHAEDMPRIHGYVFIATDYEGTPTETPEAIPLWTPINDIPFDEMWDDDRLWLPAVLSGKAIHGWFTFAEEHLLDSKIQVLSAPNQPT
ncbi:MAG: 8-oxo-dGTP diphosphatase [SAR86 cluster bacterium]|uniref:Oxidized purine nucleoside triphosphate hydrolase n=1 Tax=SAR86 cluster bacterium TaxID=2030880 RepID=A0A972VYD9_9GAMM|nr:8-oxo-dGTP diphosphatase [SAR86 cluster bacterium]